MYSINIFVDCELHAYRRMEHLPRIGEGIKLCDGTTGKVVDVVWRLDVEQPEGQCINLAVESD